MNTTTVERSLFGRLPEGEPVYCFTLVNDTLRAEIITFGACIVSVQAPNANGELAHVVLGSHDLREYVRKDKAYLGAICGRYAGRIAGASIAVDGKSYALSANDGGHATLHGGAEGFDARNWSAKPLANGVQLSLCSPDGDQGFPGELHTTVTYLLEGSSLRMLIEARTDANTVVNLTNHAYFNMDGEGQGSIRQHSLQIHAHSTLAQDSQFIPTGEVLAVEGTAFDFRDPKKLDAGLNDLSREDAASKGYNTTFLLAGTVDTPAARLRGRSGRVLEVFTSEPTLHLYSAGYFDNIHTGFSGVTYGPEAGLALEAQHCPDSPHHPHFPSTFLRPHEAYRSETVWKFSFADDL